MEYKNVNGKMVIDYDAQQSLIDQMVDQKERRKSKKQKRKAFTIDQTESRGIQWNGQDSDHEAMVNLVKKYWTIQVFFGHRLKADDITKRVTIHDNGTVTVVGKTGTHLFTFRPDHQVAEDCVQDATIRQWSNWVVGKNYPIAHYLWYAVHRMRVAVARRMAICQMRPIDDLDDLADKVPDLELEPIKLLTEYKRSRPKQCLLLRWQGLTQEDIAYFFGISQSSVSRSINDAISSVRMISIEHGITIRSAFIRYMRKD